MDLMPWCLLEVGYSSVADGRWLYDGSSGFGRIHRQYTVIRAMINVTKASIVTNSLARNAFIGTTVKTWR